MLISIGMMHTLRRYLASLRIHRGVIVGSRQALKGVWADGAARGGQMPHAGQLNEGHSGARTHPLPSQSWPESDVWGRGFNCEYCNGF